MIHSRRTAEIIALLVAFYFLFPRRVYAYLDPGTGSYVLQLIMAGLLGVAFLAKVYWRNVKAFLSNLLRKRREGREEDEDDNE